MKKHVIKKISHELRWYMIFIQRFVHTFSFMLIEHHSLSNQHVTPNSTLHWFVYHGSALVPRYEFLFQNSMIEVGISNFNKSRSKKHLIIFNHATKTHTVEIF